jgi:lipopolysaccharide export system protein LptA
MNRRGLFLLLFFVFFFFFLSSGESQEGKTKANEEPPLALGKGFGFKAGDAPIEIGSDSVEAEQKQNKVTFKGNVIAKQGEITLYTDTLTVLYNQATKKIKEIRGVGNVKIVQLDRRVTSHQATFHQDENKVVLEGEVVVREGENVVRGDRVIYYLNEEKAVVEGSGKGRVTTRLTPSSKEK